MRMKYAGAVALLCAVAEMAATRPAATVVGRLKLVGFAPLPEVGFHQLTVGRTEGRWCLYAEGRRAAVLDVDDPANPRASGACPAEPRDLASMTESTPNPKPLFFVVEGGRGRSYVVQGPSLRVVDGGADLGSFHAPRQANPRPVPAELVVDARGFVYFSQSGVGVWILSAPAASE